MAVVTCYWRFCRNAFVVSPGCTPDITLPLQPRHTCRQTLTSRQLPAENMVKVGDKIPSSTLKNTDLSDLTTEDLCTGKKVVIFAVPGAFTPTCSKDHAPGFIKHAADLKAKGVDTIACVSVNDPFVMAAWAKDLGAGNAVLFLADGNGEFTQAMGLELDGRGFNLGTRSQRYAMLVDDGVITKLEVEAGGGLTCSSAESVLALL